MALSLLKPALAGVSFCLCLAGVRALAHEGHEHEPGSAPFYAVIDDFHASPSTTEATGEIFLSLNPERTELSYRIELDGLLGLKQNIEDRTDPDDIIGIHLHLHVPDTTGPHVLNIFGLATYNVLQEEDADRVIDYENQVITGIWDNGDATINPETGEPFLPIFPLTSKPVTDWLDELEDGRLMVAVHTNETGFPTMAIHGHISAVPEPAAVALLLAGLPAAWMIARRRHRAEQRPNLHSQKSDEDSL